MMTSDPRAAPGRLLLMPNTLDLGVPAVPLEDVLARGVIAQAAQVRHWVVENARSARAFLQRVNQVVPLSQPLQALAIVELPRPQKGGAKGAPGRPPGAIAADLIAPILAGSDLGLLSEAGLPGVADPGALVVAAAHAAGLPVIALSGPSSITLALAASGLDGQSFAFLGYLPAGTHERASKLREIEATSRRLVQTQVFIETPYRNAALFQTALECLQETTRLALSCGLTLPGGWSRCESVAGWKARPPALPDRVPAVYALLA